MNLKSIKEIDNAISSELFNLNSIAESLQLEKLCEFQLDANTSKICDAAHSFPGIYLFELKNIEKNYDVKSWMDAFTLIWAHPDYHMQWVPGLKKKRIAAHSKFEDWIPLYIGKSKNIGNRINEHLLKDLMITTFAMKLKARKNLYGNSFRVSALRMDVENYDVVVPYLENVLRNRLNPIVGKQ